MENKSCTHIIIVDLELSLLVLLVHFLLLMGILYTYSFEIFHDFFKNYLFMTFNGLLIKTTDEKEIIQIIISFKPVSFIFADSILLLFGFTFIYLRD